MKTSKIYSPHRHSIQQVSNSNMAANSGPDVHKDSARSNIGAKKNKYTGTRKFAYSLTDK